MDIRVNPLAAPLPNSALTNSSVTISGHTLALGGSLSFAAADISGLTTADSPSFVGLTLSGTIGAVSGTFTCNTSGAATALTLSNSPGLSASDAVDVSYVVDGTEKLHESIGRDGGNTYGFWDIKILNNGGLVSLMSVNSGVVPGVSPLTVSQPLSLASTLSVTGHATLEGVTSTGATGTGKFVFDTSPTLGSPALTDPAISTWVACTSQLSKSTDTNLATVTGLSVALAAGKTYIVRGWLNGSSGASGGIKVALVASGSLSATSCRFNGYLCNGTTNVAVTTVTALGSNIAASTAIYTDLYIEGTIVVNAAGTINVQAAQNASNGTATTVNVNSNFTCTRIN